MTRAFTRFCFTPSVVDMQKQQGATGLTGALLLDETEAFDTLTENEISFISQMEGFYQATVSETGWPYVQFRGGPRGFLKVVDSKTIAYADYSGNRQYLSTGNLTANNKVSLILMDYPNNRRLKIWGQVTLIDRKEDADLVSGLHEKSYRALPERAVVIAVEAFDWNCPRHIPQRYTLEELEPTLVKYREEINRLRAEVAELKKHEL